MAVEYRLHFLANQAFAGHGSARYSSKVVISPGSNAVCWAFNSRRMILPKRVLRRVTGSLADNISRDLAQNLVHGQLQLREGFRRETLTPLQF